jgi:hypothetical protein
MSSPRPYSNEELANACEQAARAEIFSINQLELVASKYCEPETGARLIAEFRQQAEMLAEAGRRLRELEHRRAA